MDSICETGDNCSVNGMDRDGLIMRATSEIYDALTNIANAGVTTASPTSNPDAYVFDKLNPSDAALVRAALKDPGVRSKIADAIVREMTDPLARERSLAIYVNGKGVFRTGEIIIGETKFKDGYINASGPLSGYYDQLGGVPKGFTWVINFHTHLPIPWSGFASKGDIDFNRISRTIGIIWTPNSGFIFGRTGSPVQ